MGAGFGGLGAALTLAEQGARVLLLEALTYPGGCASTFTRKGHRFESGATLFSGFGEGQLFAQWIKQHRLPVHTQALTPMVRFRSDVCNIDVPSDRATFVETMCALPEAPVQKLRAFFSLQGRAATVLWSLFSDPALLPPLRVSALFNHLLRAPGYLPLVPWLGRSLGAVLGHFGLRDYRPLRVYLDAVCQITVQAPADEAEAAFGFAAMDYYFHGTHHVRGGIGALAGAMCDAIVELGGEVRFGERVTRVDSAVHTSKRGEHRAPIVMLNLLPQDAARVLGQPVLPRVGREVEGGWGACMLYRVLPKPAAPMHFQLIGDASQPLRDGNHVFCSYGDEGSLTVSTHVHGEVDVAAVQQRMRETISKRAPELDQDVALEMPASPRTFARFVGRHGGLVGGIPRRTGLAQYLRMGPARVGQTWLLGDSYYLGQSTLACAIAGQRTARAALGSTRHFAQYHRSR